MLDSTLRHWSRGGIVWIRRFPGVALVVSLPGQDTCGRITKRKSSTRDSTAHSLDDIPMLDIPKFIYHQQPVYWYLLAGTFFLLGLLYASVAWRSWKRRLQRAERSQANLLDDRKKAILDRQRRWQTEGNLGIAEVLTQAEPTTPQPEKTESAQPEPLPAEPVQPEAATPAALVTASHLHPANGSHRMATEAELAKARAIAGLFSDSYASGSSTPRNGTHEPQTQEQADREYRAQKLVVRPNPWTNYTK